MSESRLADIREQLLAEQNRIGENLEAARGKVRELEAELEQIQNMLAVGERRTAKGAGRRKKRCLSRDDVSELIASVLGEKGVVGEEELKELVEQRAVEAGCSRTGLALRFKEAIKDDRFVDSPGGYRLEDQTSEASEEFVLSGNQGR
jgi:hypothetical protein